MKRFITLTAATALAATPLLAEQATQKANQPGSPIYSENFPPEDAYGSAGLIGSDVYTTKLGRANESAANLEHDDVTNVGEVADVVMSGNGNMSGILVDLSNDDSDSMVFIPASQVTIVRDVEGTRYMIGHTDDEMSEIERIERDNWK